VFVNRKGIHTINVQAVCDADMVLTDEVRYIQHDMTDGKKVVIGDSLSSHINVTVLKACSNYNIAFTALPPNSTHLTQPVDVAYFRPMKTAGHTTLALCKEP